MPVSAWSRIALCLAIASPAAVLRLSGAEVPPLVALLVFGAAVVAASFLLAWTAEAASVDISGALAIAILALIAVLPEYAVDLYYAFTSGSDPAYEAFAAANMTGSNRLLLGLGWPLVALVALLWLRRRRAAGDLSAPRATSLRLEPRARLDLGFLAILGLAAFAIPLMGTIPVWFGVLLVLVFVAYLWRSGTQADDGTGENGADELVGMAAHIGGMPTTARRTTVIALFVVAAAIILSSAEPFADALVHSGQALGIDSFFLVQWLAPLASEAPEFIVAILFALRGHGGAAIGTLIASKVNQWSLLVGSLPIAHLVGGGGGDLALDARQVEEFTLTATQTVLGIALLLTLRFRWWAAIGLVALFAAQFAVTDTTGRYVLSGIHVVLAIAALVVHRRGILPTLAAPFRRQSAGAGAVGPGADDDADASATTSGEPALRAHS